MSAVRVERILEKDGEVVLTGLPYKKGERVKVTLSTTGPSRSRKPVMTARDLLSSGLAGLWKDRTDIADSSEFARKLREEAQNRELQ
jgi:hypothetical protein